MAAGVGNILEVFKAIPAGKKISFLITFSIVIGGFVALLMYTNRPVYQPLFSDLTSSDEAKIVDKLKEKRIPYRLRESDGTIEVPEEMVHQARLDLATEGLPAGGSVGFEVFDNMSFGTTEFEMKLRHTQALQGELERTIRSIDVVEQARVHIVAAGDSMFAVDEKPATASVVLKIAPGRALSFNKLQGIVHIVSRSVEGLQPENVSVVDTEGGILTKGQDKNGMGNVSNDQFEYQQRMAEAYEKKIVDMLEPFVGAKKVKATVTLDVDFRSVKIEEEIFDPDSVFVKSEQTIRENSSDGNRMASGSPDLQGQNVGGGLENVGTASKSSESENSIINYEYNKKLRKEIDTPGEITRLSASVIIDGPYDTSTDADGNTVKVFRGLDRKQKKSFEDIVKKAIGFNEERGDQVVVENLEGSADNEIFGSMPEPAPEGWMVYVKKGSKPILNVLLIGLFFIIAIKPFKKWMAQTSEYVSARALPQGGRTNEYATAGPSEVQIRQNDKFQLLEATKQNPDMAADIIKTWLNEVS